jgi:hypothetical protein
MGRGTVTTFRLGQPAELRDRLQAELPRQPGATLGVRVTPRDRRERRCPAYDADHYEVHAFYTTANLDALTVLETALRAVPGVYLTTRVQPGLGGNIFSNPAWPDALGIARRDRNDLRPQVIALIRDPQETDGE